MASQPEVLVVVPTFNERENLPLLARAVFAHDGYRMLVVDDSSPDGTGQVADALAREFPGRLEVIHRTGRRALGLSYIDGLRAALAGSADIIVQMDADLSHDPAYLPTMVAAMAEYDMVIGSRYMTGVSVVNWPLHRIFLSAFANRSVRAVTGVSPSDCTSGFRCWRREALAQMPLTSMVSNGYAFVVEMLFEASRRGFRVGEVPIVFVERRQGESKVSGRVLAESLVVPWRLRFGRPRKTL